MDYVGNITMKGHYKINGRILILPVVGDGDYTNEITNMHLTMKYKVNKFNKDDGKEHWRMELLKRSYKVEKAHFNLKNLFGGNKILGEPTLQFLNENWDIIMNDIAPPAVDQIVQLCMETVNVFYDKVPANELLLP